VYSIEDYGWMTADAVRMDAYVQALREAMRPGCVVLDIGAGTGVFSLLACRFGARHVYAVEPADAIQVAREAVEAAGFGDRVTFFQEMSTEVSLLEPADVMVSDLRGILPLFHGHIPCIADARERLLAPGAAVIPRRDILCAAVVSAPDRYRELVSPWTDGPAGVPMEAGRRLVVNSARKAQMAADQLLVPAGQWAVLDYTTIRDPDVRGELSWTVGREGTGHGLLVWFDTELAEGIGFSNAPGGPELIYGQTFFPWTEPVKLAPGDLVTVRFDVRLVGENYVWRWNTRVREGGDAEPLKADFRQSTFYSVPLSPASLSKQGDGHVPELNAEGEARLFVLDLMRGEATVGEIARRVRERYPDRFPRWQDALTMVGELSRRFSL
jgi:protein arginine N-methyltransferase 1